MLDFSKLEQLARDAGFTNAAPLRADTLVLKQEVRDMCAANSCGKYDKCWTCPPACGTLEECKARIQNYTAGILVQTTGTLEDSFDIEGMMDTEEKHKKNFKTLYRTLRQEYPNTLPLSAGCCTHCQTCSYPEQPCRFPEEQISSMEAYGLLVLEVCKDNDLQYYYGANTMTYTSCLLLV